MSVVSEINFILTRSITIKLHSGVSFIADTIACGLKLKQNYLIVIMLHMCFKNMFVSIKYLNKSQCRDGVSNRGPVGCESGNLPTRLCMYVSLSL